MSAFDDYLAEQLREPAFREAFDRYSAEIREIDDVIRAIEARRQECRVSKAALARAMGKEPATVRRLLSDESVNPTLRTVLAAMRALDLELRVVPREPADEVRPTFEQPAHAG